MKDSSYHSTFAPGLRNSATLSVVSCPAPILVFLWESFLHVKNIRIVLKLPSAPILLMVVKEDENTGNSSQGRKDTFEKADTKTGAGQNGAGAEQGKGERPRRSTRNTRIEYCKSKRSRGISFSKRKSGLIKKADELSVISGSQVLLVIASETGRVYTYATDGLRPVLKKCEYAIYECLNSHMPRYK